nr:MAG TPA: hypothetical protein [Caudoviricetes sp.]
MAVLQRFNKTVFFFIVVYHEKKFFIAFNL